MNQTQKGFSAIALIIIVGILVFVGAFGVRYFTKKADETAGWKIYKNEKFGFTLKYPPQWESVHAGDVITGRTETDPGRIIGDLVKFIVTPRTSQQSECNLDLVANLTAQSNTSGFSTEEWIRTRSIEGLTSTKNLRIGQRDFIVGDYPPQADNFCGLGSNIFYLATPDFLLDIVIYPYNSERTEVFDKALETLKIDR